MAAEVFGVVAGGVGIAGLCGQILEGCMFLSQQFQNIKTAPKNIQRLVKHISLLHACIEDFSGHATIIYGEAAERQGYVRECLKRCLDDIRELEELIADPKTKFSGGSRGKWSDRIKTAWNQPTIEKCCGNIDRAMQAVQTAQNNLALVGCLQTISTIRNIPAETATVILSKISQKMCTSTAAAPNSALRHGESSHQERPTMLSVAVSSRLHEVQNIESIEAISSRYHGDQDIEGRVLSHRCVTPYLKYTSRSYNSYNLVYGVRLMVRSSTSVNSSMWEKSKEVIETEYEVVFNLPFLRRGVKLSSTANGFEANNLYGLSTYNVVQHGSPLEMACRSLDVARVQSLLSAGMATPYDRDPMGRTPLQWAMSWHTWQVLPASHTVETGMVDRLIALIRLFRPYASTDESDLELLFMSAYWSYFNGDHIAGPLRQLLHSTRQGEWLTVTDLKFSAHYVDSEVCDILASAGIIQKGAKNGLWNGNGVFLEGVFQLVCDPLGEGLSNALSRGLSPDMYKNDFSYVSTPWQYSPTFLGRRNFLFDLLACAAAFPALRSACINRMLMLLKSGAFSSATDPYRWYTESRKATVISIREYRRSLSLGEYAELLGIFDLYKQILYSAGWTIVEVDDMIESDFYAGVAELMGGNMAYITTKEFRASFLDALCSGRVLPIRDSFSLRYGGRGYSFAEVCLGLKLTRLRAQDTLLSMAEDANTAFRCKYGTGAWPQDGPERVELNADVDCLCRGNFYYRTCNGCFCDWQAFTRGRLYKSMAFYTLEDQGRARDLFKNSRTNATDIVKRHSDLLRMLDDWDENHDEVIARAFQERLCNSHMLDGLVKTWIQGEHCYTSMGDVDRSLVLKRLELRAASSEDLVKRRMYEYYHDLMYEEGLVDKNLECNSDGAEFSLAQQRSGSKHYRYNWYP